MKIVIQPIVISILCAFLSLEFWGCSGEVDSHGLEKLKFFQKTPPNIKSDYEIIVGDRDAKNYSEIKGPVKFIRQRHYEIAKDAKGNLLPAHFSGTTEINYRENGTLADFTYYDSTGGTILLQAFVIYKNSRKEIYLHLAEDNKDFVYICDKNGRILEQGNDRVYKQSELDHSWNSTDGHFSWEENPKQKIIAGHINLPSGEYRHLYEYDENDSLVRIKAFNRDNEEMGRFSWKYDPDGKLVSASFEYDHQWFRPDILDFEESYRYDAYNRLISVITTQLDPSWDSNSWPPFVQKDTLRMEYKDRDGFVEKNTFNLGSPESKTLYDTYGTAIAIETYGTFIYEGPNGTGETYDIQRLEREIEYYDQSQCDRWPHLDTKSMVFVPIKLEKLFPENQLPCFKIFLDGTDSLLWKGCLDNNDPIQLLSLNKNKIHAALVHSLLILGQDQGSKLYCIDTQKPMSKLENMDNLLPHKRTEKESMLSLPIREFTRLKPDEAMYICSPNSKDNFATCVTLNHYPNQNTFNAIGSIAHKNNSEIFLIQQTSPDAQIFVTHDKCAFIPNHKDQNDQILFENDLITFKRSPYKGFLGDTVRIPLSDLPCRFK